MGITERVCNLMRPLLDRLVEARATAKQNRPAFAVSLIVIFIVSFTITIISLGYSEDACSPRKQVRSQLFVNHFLFNAFIFIGVVFHTNSTRIPTSITLAFCLICTSIAMFLLNFATQASLSSMFYAVIGACLGAAQSSVVHGFLKVFHNNNFILTYAILVFSALGSATASMLFQTTPLSYQKGCHSLSAVDTGTPHIPSLEKFHLNPSLRIDVIYYSISGTLIITVVWLMFVDYEKQVDNPEASKEDYDEIDGTNDRQAVLARTTCLKLGLFCSVIAGIANNIYTLFPFLLLAQPNASILNYQLFLMFFLWGRCIAMFISDNAAAYFMIGLSIIGCGVASCCFVFDEAHILGSILFGLFLSLLLPSILTYLRHTISMKEHVVLLVLTGHSSSNVIFPLQLTMAPSEESRMFVAINIVAIILLVILFVSILNLHAQLEKMRASQGSLNLFISRFLSGESLLKRTRSIRPLISRLRPNSYRRFMNRRNNRTGTPSPIPKIEVTRTMTSPVPV